MATPVLPFVRRPSLPGPFRVFLFMLSLFPGCTSRHETPGTNSAADALKSFELADGFKIELLASEPLLGDPVDMEIDEAGHLYVVEMPGYPLNTSGTGVVKQLFDKDGDGLMDSSVVFADQLVLPNSVMRWKNGLLVTDAPYVLYFEDRDHDGRAEIRDTLLTGFALSNPQHNLNSPVLNIDNWIYLSHEGAVSTEAYQKEFGDKGSEIHFPGHDRAPRLGVNANGRSVRVRPDEFLLETTSSHSQFGQTFDQWGHQFLVGNANHIYWEVVAARYLERNKHLLLSNPSESISDHGDAAEVFPITENPQRQLLTDVGVITSACGLITYLGGGFPEPYNEGVTFVAEPVSNLVHVDKVVDKGTSFVASRLLEHQEFLASRDARFRPVNLYTGPDGALYVVDYYRQIIEHPEWMGEEVIRSGDLYNDSDRGRIYRITPKDYKPAQWTRGLSLGTASTAELVGHLSHPNYWWRMHAQRLLIDRMDPDAMDHLRNVVETGKSAEGRLHALWTLEGMHMLTDDLIRHGLGDEVAGVRENSIRLAELHLKETSDLVNVLLSMAGDANAKVRYQLLCTLGYVTTPEADRVRKEILFKDVNDPWMRVAALTAPVSQSVSLFTEVLMKAQSDPNAYKPLIERLSAMMISDGDVSGVNKLLHTKLTATDDASVAIASSILNGMATGQERSAHPVSLRADQREEMFQTIFNHPATAVGTAALRLLRASNTPAAPPAVAGMARTIALDRDQKEDRRALAADVLALGNPQSYQQLFTQLLSAAEPLPVQLSALRGLSNIPGTDVSHTLIAQWPSLTPEVHDAAVATFLRDPDRIAALLQAIEDRKVPASDISWPRRVGLMAQANHSLRDKARALFAQSDDKQIRGKMANVLALKGEPHRGMQVYQQNCGLCHQIRGKMGIGLGPDLGTVHNWSAEAILSNIVNPNQSISSGFDLCRVQLVNGEQVQGIIASESPTALTLRNNGSAERIINRSDIKSLQALNMSIMPDDLAQKIDPQSMADLLAFLKQNK